MSTFRRLLSRALPLSVFSVFALAGCSSLPGGPEPRARHEARGGFTVRVDGAGLPAAKAVAADVGAFAQRRGFVHQATKPVPATDPVTHEPLPAAPERYATANMALEVSHQPADHRVSVYLHGFGTKENSKFIERFYREFSQEYAGRYGGADRISESAYAEDASGPSGSAGTLGPGGPPDSNSPRETGVPPVSGNPSGVGGPSGLGAPTGL